MSASIPYADHCPTKPGQGFESAARPAVGNGCEPGFIPPRCKAARSFKGSVAATTTIELKIGGFQSAQPIAIVDLDSDPLMEITDLKVNQISLFYRIEPKNTVTEAALVTGLGQIVFLTDEQVRSGTARIPPSPLTDQNNPFSVFVTNPTAGSLDFEFAIYWGNPFGYVKKVGQA